MHETQTPNYIGYIDNFYVEGTNLRISGWLISKHFRDDINLYVKTDREIAIYNYNERQDVATFYGTQNIDYINCGFDVTIPNTGDDTVHIYSVVKGIKETIFSLSKISNRAELVPTQLMSEGIDIKLKPRYTPEVIVVDNFYENPDEVRQFALSQNFEPDLRYHKGNRTQQQFLPQGMKQTFETLLGRKIVRWTEFNYNGVFQYCIAEDPLVYHSDLQSYAGAIYLTPNAPVETGTSFFRSKNTGVRSTHVSDPNYNETFKNGFYDKTQFELVDTIGNVYNRLVIWNSSLIHSASGYFGTDKYNSRLFHLFFFDVEG